MTLDLQKVHCPICSENSYKKKYLIQDWNIVQCNHCNFVYVNPRLTNSAILDLYKKDYFHNNTFGYVNYMENPHLKELNFEKWIKDALPFLKEHTMQLKALDIGCAAGYAINIYRELGIIATGLEMDPEFISTLQKKEIKVFTRPLLENEYTSTYHIISLFDVVEHLTDLDASFDKLQQILDPNGIVIMVTPDYNSKQRKLFGKKWFQFKPIEHINYFTRESLTALAERHHLELVICKKSGQFADLAFIQDRLQKYHFKPALFIIKPIFRLISLFKKSFYLDAASIYCIFRKK